MSDTVNDQEKILKVISRAILGGWDKDIAAGFVQIIPDMFADEYPDAKNNLVRGVLLDHSFAKAYWPEKSGDIAGHTVGGINTWQYNLQQAVLADDLINYYYERI